MDIPATVTGIVEVDAYSSYGKADGFMQHGRFSGDHGFSWDYRAYLKFGLDSLPDTCVLLSAKLEYFQFDHNALPSVCIKLIRDPVPLSAAELYNEIVGARAITPFTEQPNGWVEWDLNSNALIDSCRKTGWASFGIDCNNFGGGDAWGYTDSLAPFLHIEYALPNETDIQALRAELGTNPAAVRGADTALLRLTNKGPYASGMFWAYASLGFARESTLVQPVAVGETVSVRIAMPAPLTQDTMTYYRLWTDYETDLRHSNDTAKLSCWAFPAGAYAAEGFDASGFPPNGWSLMSLDGGPHGWARRADSGLSHSGTGFASCTDESTGTSDDWLMSSPICPGGQYRDDSVGFFVRGTSRVAPDTLDVLAMSVSHLPVTLLSLDTWTTAYCRHSVSLDAFDGDTIRVAFRHRASGSGNDVYLDDVWFSHTFSPDTGDTSHVHIPPRDSVRSSNVALPKLAFAQSPASGRFVTVRCSLAVGRVRRLTIRDVAGRAVRTFALNPSGITQLDLRDFPPGVYLATLQGSVPLVSRKLVISPR